MDLILKIQHLIGLFRHISDRLYGRYSDIAETFLGFFSGLRLKKNANNTTVLLLEFNPWHGEILPGFALYFQKLGYRVIAVSRYAHYKDNPFVRMQTVPEFACMSLHQMGRFLISAAANKYAYILVTSDRICLPRTGKLIRTLDFHGALPSPEKGIGIVEHEAGKDLLPTFREYDTWSLKRQLENAFVLTPCILAGISLPMLNPCSFGMIKQKKTKNDTVTFITVGSIRNSKKNFSMLGDTLQKLQGKWRLLIVGSVEDPVCLAGLPGCVEVLGRLSFIDLYEKMEISDFLLPLLDPDCKGHQHYLESCTSGSRQLALGFAKIPVIHQAFGRHYGFSTENAVFYEKDDLREAMQYAIDMPEDEYRRRVECLQGKCECIFDESLMNLKRRLNLL